MELRRGEEALEIADIDPFLAELLRQIPESTDPAGAPAAEQRLFSAPTERAEDSFAAEWKLYVEPELRDLFRSATEIVAEDLRQLAENPKPFANCTLRIAHNHTEAWLSALNQARLVIAAKNGFTEKDLGDHYRSPLGCRRDLSLFQVNFYGFLQELLLRDA